MFYSLVKFPLGIEPRMILRRCGCSIFDANEVTEEKVQETQVSYKPPQSSIRPELKFRCLRKYFKPVEGELTEGPGKTQSSITFEPAKKAAQMMKQVHDQLLKRCIQHLRSELWNLFIWHWYSKDALMISNWDEEGNYSPEFKQSRKLVCQHMGFLPRSRC